MLRELKSGLSGAVPVNLWAMTFGGIGRVGQWRAGQKEPRVSQDFLTFKQSSSAFFLFPDNLIYSFCLLISFEDTIFLQEKCEKKDGRKSGIMTSPGHFYLCLGMCSVLSSVASVMSDSLHPMGCSLPDSSVYGILQARILERVAISYYRGSSQPRNRTPISGISFIVGSFFSS